MNKQHEYYRLFQELLEVTSDGFIIVDPLGIITEINQPYCDFLGKKREDVMGKPIRDIISTTSMYDVLKNRHRGEGRRVYLHPYNESDNSNNVKTYAVGNRFCFFDEDDNLLGAAAQLSFKERTLSVVNSLVMEELNFYKAEYQSQGGNVDGFDNILGIDPKMVNLKRCALKVAKKNFPILITGETGTGKEVFAKAIHAESTRKDKAIISINCAAIPSELLESELFGYAEGAFTGAKRGGKIGKFQFADKGTLFLDEIGDMELHLQAKLLRVLQEQEIERVGGGAPIPIDIRVIAATRQNLPDMIQAGTFREDLYYRLNVINLEIIPLRERPEDIMLFANHTLTNLNQQYKTNILMSDATKHRLQQYNWPGNVRELINVITSAYAACDTMMIDEVDLPARLITRSRVNDDEAVPKKLVEMVADYETAVIRNALRRHDQNCREAARELGVDRSLLYRKMKKAGISIKKVMEDADTL